MKKIALFVLVFIFLGCAIYMPAPPHIVTPNYEIRFNTYGHGWIWPFVPYPGIGWDHRYYRYGYGFPYRWVPGHPGHYE